MPLTLAVGFHTDTGRTRETNEDSLCILERPQVVKDFDAVLAIADGMGGHRAGEIASKYATDKLKELFTTTQYREWVDFKPDREDYNVLVLKEVIEKLNEQIHQMAAGREEWRGMGTTATIALIVGAKWFIGHVGDSRAYLLSNGTFRQITKDHSWVMEQVEQGIMTLEQAAVDPRKSQITRALGVSSLVKVDRLTGDLHPGDALLLCTDGLSNEVSPEEMHQHLASIADPQRACQMLVQLANQRDGSDNVTVIIMRIEESGAARAAVTVETDQSGVVTQPLVLSPKALRVDDQPSPSPEPVPPASRTEPPTRMQMGGTLEMATLPASKPSNKTVWRRVLPPTSTLLLVVSVIAVVALINAGIAYLLRQSNVDDVALTVSVGMTTFLLVGLSLLIFYAWIDFQIKHSE